MDFCGQELFNLGIKYTILQWDLRPGERKLKNGEGKSQCPPEALCLPTMVMSVHAVMSTSQTSILLLAFPPSSQSEEQFFFFFGWGERK